MIDSLLFYARPGATVKNGTARRAKAPAAAVGRGAGGSEAQPSAPEANVESGRSPVDRRCMGRNIQNSSAEPQTQYLRHLAAIHKNETERYSHLWMRLWIT